MTVPVLPESAPFTPAQRGWLNGFFAGIFGLDRSLANGIPQNGSLPPASMNNHAAPAAAEEAFPWHDPALPMDERLKLAEGKPPERLLMAAMAQLDCGSCGYLCKTYAEAIARGEDRDLTKCSPGGKETAKKLKELVANRQTLATVSPSAPATNNGHLPNGTLNGKLTDPAPATVAYDRKHPFAAPLLRCAPLTRLGSEKDVRFVAFTLRGSGLNYEVGDALGVYPENDSELVEAILDVLGARGDELVTFPDGRFVHSFEALLRDYTITKVSESFVSLLAERATEPAEEKDLRALLHNDPDGVLERADVLDLLRQFSSARPSVLEMISSLPRLQPRLYSIASSLKAHPDEVHLTVGVVRYRHKDRVRKGVASNFMAEVLRPRLKARVFIQTAHSFRLPDDRDTPIIMVGPGTGIAPFRAFLEERAAVGAKGENWLFFGDQRRDFDFLYQEEMTEYAERGVLSRLDTAFSRDQDRKVYVQHRMLENAAEIWKWLQEGAHLYVCGDARRMALDVDSALHAVVAEQGRMSADAAREYVKQLAKSKRYQRDVY